MNEEDIEKEIAYLAKKNSPYTQENPVKTTPNFLISQQQQPTGTQIVEKATNEGLQEKRQPQRPFGWNFTSTERPFIELILQAKNDYSNWDKKYQEALQAQNDLNSLENNPELRQQYMTAQGLNESQFNDLLNKQKATLANEFEQIQQGKNTAHTDAEYIRELAKQRGLTDDQLRYFGSGATLEEAGRALANSDLNAVFNLRDKYQMNSDDYYEKMYGEFREQGMSPPRAALFASDAAAKYKAERLAALGDGLSLYGRTNGALNDTGIDILSRMAQDNPEATNINLNSYAKPADEYGNAFKYQMAQVMHAMGLEDKQIAAMLNMNLEELRQAGQNYRTNLVQDRTDARANKKNEIGLYKFEKGERNKFDLAEFNSNLRREEDRLRSLHKSGKVDGGKYQLYKDRYTRIKDELKTAMENGNTEKIEQLTKDFENMGKILDTYTDVRNDVEIKFIGGDAKEDYEKIAEMLSTNFEDQEIIDSLEPYYGRDAAMLMLQKVKNRRRKY